MSIDEKIDQHQQSTASSTPVEVKSKTIPSISNPIAIDPSAVPNGRPLIQYPLTSFASTR